MAANHQQREYSENFSSTSPELLARAEAAWCMGGNSGGLRQVSSSLREARGPGGGGCSSGRGGSSCLRPPPCAVVGGCSSPTLCPLVMERTTWGALS